MTFADISIPWFDPAVWVWIHIISEWAIRLGMLLVVPFRPTAAAKGWLLLIFFQPYISLLLCFLIGRPTIPRWRIEQMARLPKVMADVVDKVLKHPNVFQPELSPELEQASVPCHEESFPNRNSPSVS
jgi:cardiolipin synthase